jgi:hypothetical protein
LCSQVGTETEFTSPFSERQAKGDSQSQAARDEGRKEGDPEGSISVHRAPQRYFASPSYRRTGHSPIEIPTGMRGYNQMLTPDLQEGPKLGQ